VKTLPVFLLFAAGVALSGSNVLQKIEGKYDDIETMSMTFSQKITYASTDQESSFRGRMLLARPGRMRMSVLEPDTQLLVSSGGSLWIYIKSANQVLFYDLTEEDYPQVSTLIFNMSEQFKSKLIGKTQDRYMLKLIPHTQSKYYDSLHARVSRRSYLVNGLMVFDKQANTIDYTFGKIRTNVEIEDSSFRFVPPPGARVIKRG
jgi:outer membrane lipoprotein carrier protein